MKKFIKTIEKELKKNNIEKSFYEMLKHENEKLIELLFKMKIVGTNTTKNTFKNDFKDI